MNGNGEAKRFRYPEADTLQNAAEGELLELQYDLVLARQHIDQLRDKYHKLASKYAHLRLDFVHMKCVLADIVKELNSNTKPKRGSQLSKLRIEARHLLDKIETQERKL
jgi:hypothetical protein